MLQFKGIRSPLNSE